MARPFLRRMLVRIVSWCAAIIVNPPSVILPGVIAWNLRRLPERGRRDIEAKHRDTLRSARNSGVGLVIDMVPKHLGVPEPDLAISKIIGHVGQSVHGALKMLGQSHVVLENIAPAKL